MTDVQTVPLDPARLIAAAVAEVGFDDIGDADFLDCLTAFCDAIRTEGRLTEMGTMATEMDIVRLLANRLRLHRDLQQHPEILDEELVPPIVVTGLVRTGTSKLQRVLSEDPGVQRLDWWRLMNPGRIVTTGGEPDPRIEIARQLEQMLANFPEFMAAHPTAAGAADEDLMLYELTFDSYIPVFRYTMPSFAKRVLARPAAPSYHYVRTLLQYLQWQDGGARGRPWVLKTPVHMGHLPVLFENYPGATVVHCHRHPRVIVPSFVRLVEILQNMRTDHVDTDLIGRQTIDYWSDMIIQSLRDRDAGYGENVVDVMYSDLRADPLAVIETIYDRAGRELTPEARARFASWERDNSYHRLGKHEYSLERYGLSGEMIDDRFAEYIERFFPNAEAM